MSDENTDTDVTLQWRLTLEQVNALNAYIDAGVAAGKWAGEEGVDVNAVIMEQFPDVDYVWVRRVPGMDPRHFPQVPPSEAPKVWNGRPLEEFLAARRRLLDSQ